MLSGFPHIRKAIEHSITSEESRFPSLIIDRKLVSANAIIFAVFQRACESDSFIMIQILGEGITWVIQQLKLLLLNDLNESQTIQGKTMNQFSEGLEIKFIGAR